MNEKVIISVVSNNFRLVYKVEQAISEDYAFHHSSLSDNFSKTTLIVTDSSQIAKQISHPNIIIISDNKEIDVIRAIILYYLKDISLPKVCVIGIDPGKTIGVAIIYMNEIFATNSFLTLESLIHWIKQKVIILKFDELIIKVGDGNKKESSQLFKSISQEFSIIGKVLLVDEKFSSIRRTRCRNIHEEAAIIIANREQ